MDKKNNNQSEQKFINIQKKIQDQDKIINKSIQLNYDLSNQINLLNNKINELLKHNEKKTSFIKKDTSMTKEEFFQSENLRLSNELHEARKKYEIMKVEINKFENQRSNIIKKINSLNSEIEDGNVLTNVFENNLQNPKIKIIDNNIERKETASKINLNEEVIKIFKN